MRGPRPIPTHLKLLRGNPGHQVLNKSEPEPVIPDDVPEPPAFLSGHARDEWWRVVTELYRLKLVTLVDINPLAAYCQAYARWRYAEEALAKMAERDPVTSGLMIKNRAGNAIQNPLVMTADHAAAAMVRYASEFGLTPAARSRITSPDADGSVASKFDGLIAG
jgi:P27 family predicted phage terminase small subunit